MSFLGGAGEIGMNMYLYETEKSAVVVDCGVQFANNELPGVDYVIPDFSYLKTIKDKLKAIILSHGHEDHIGGICYLLQRFDLPIYSGRLTIELLKYKLAEFKIKGEFIEVSDQSVRDIDDINLRFFQVNHSIPDTFGIKIKSGKNAFLHMSDFKIDKTPVSQKPFSRERFLKFLDGDKITGMLCDSTCCFYDGFSPSEKSVKEDLYKIIKNATGRIFFTTFSSNIDRIKQVIEICEELNKKVVFEGRSILKNILIAQKLGYINYNPQNIVNLNAAKGYKDRELLFIISGCQGEQNSTLYKIVSKERTSLQVKKGDLFIISSRVIPGNEKDVNRAINFIYYNDAKVVDVEKENIHVSGHGYREDINEIVLLAKPKYFIPIHGEFMHQKENIENMTFNSFVERCLFVEDGKQLLFDEECTLKEVIEIPCEKVYIDTRGVGEFKEEALKVRKNLARDGAIIVIYNFNKIKDISNFKIYSIGFELSDSIVYYLKRGINENLSILLETVNYDIFEFEDILRKFIKKLVKKRIDRRPEIKIINLEGVND